MQSPAMLMRWPALLMQFLIEFILQKRYDPLECLRVLVKKAMTALEEL